MNHITVGVYANGEMKVNVVPRENLYGHIEYNRIVRPGRALFVDGECHLTGLLNKESIEASRVKIATLVIDTSIPSKEYQ